ncbi:MAG: exosortase/archaeosortase family protein [Verrucomicrobiota bacterium]|jgi:exosortase
MQAIEQDNAGPSGNFGQELQYYWKKLPDGTVFLGLLAAWCLLFYYFGWTSAQAGRNDSIFSWMWGKWSDPANDSSHGKVIPLVVLGLLWVRRQRLVSSISAAWWPGLAGLALALALHVLGFVVQQPRISMVAFFSGAWILTGLMWGRETLKASFFPFFIFAFCVPMGGTFAQGLTLPLRHFARDGAAFILRDVLQVPVQLLGSTKLAGEYGSFDVAAECSGIRSFIALLAITTIFSVLTMRTTWRRGVMILSTIPLALICNMIRITTILFAANAFKTAAAGKFVDDYFGYVTYGVAIGVVLLLGRWLKEKPLVVSP